jgi:hypothetical protein
MAMPGLLKIGFTTRSVKERIEELSHTGVPVKYQLELEITTSEPEILEKRFHGLFSKYHYQKEFFKCEIEVATRLIKGHLETTDIKFDYISGRASKKYFTSKELDEIEEAKQRKIRLEEQKKAEAIANEAYIYELAKSYEPEFSQLLESVNRAFIKHRKDYENSLTGKFFNRSPWWDVGTAVATLGVSLLPSAIFTSGPDFPDGKFIAKLYVKSEIDELRKFFNMVQMARSETENDPRFKRGAVVWTLNKTFQKGRKANELDKILSGEWFTSEVIDLLQALKIFELPK